MNSLSELHNVLSKDAEQSSLKYKEWKRLFKERNLQPLLDKIQPIRSLVNQLNSQLPSSGEGFNLDAGASINSIENILTELAKYQEYRIHKAGLSVFVQMLKAVDTLGDTFVERYKYPHSTDAVCEYCDMRTANVYRHIIISNKDNKMVMVGGWGPLTLHRAEEHGISPSNVVRKQVRELFKKHFIFGDE